MSLDCPLIPLFPNLSLLQQNGVVAAMIILLAAGTWLLLQFYEFMQDNNYWKSWVKLWPSLGIFPYFIVGLTHFGDDAIANICIVPPNGTWGWWWLPLSRELVVTVTGCFEIVVGPLLTISGLFNKAKLRQWSSWILFYLTLGMTFANIYMVTHVSWFIEFDQQMNLIMHIIRGLLQCIWLSNLLYMAKDYELYVGEKKSK